LSFYFLVDSKPFFLVDLRNLHRFEVIFRSKCVLFFVFVRLNLINHFVVFIPCQFAYNSAFRNPVFRWESCKGSVRKSAKKSSKLKCNSAGAHNWIYRLARSWQVTKTGTCVKHVGELKKLLDM